MWVVVGSEKFEKQQPDVKGVMVVSSLLNFGSLPLLPTCSCPDFGCDVIRHGVLCVCCAPMNHVSAGGEECATLKLPKATYIKPSFMKVQSDM